jgi:hypothetical protein
MYMKKLLLLLALFSAMSFYGQHKVAGRVGQLIKEGTTFTKFSPLTVNTLPQTTTAVSNATFATMNKRVVANIVANKYPYVELTIPYNGSTVALQMYRVEVLAQGFHADTDRQTNISWTDGVHYRGIVKGDSNSLVSFNFFGQEMNGIISATGINNLVVGRMQATGNRSNYIIYSDARLSISNPFRCGVTDSGTLPAQQNTSREAFTEHCVTNYFEIAHDIYLANESDTTLTTNWMTSVFNNVQTLFENDGITVALKSIYIWTEQDPYFGGNSGDYLEQFYSLRPIFDGDAGQLVTTNGGGLGGVAINIAGLCSDANVSFSDLYFDYQDVPLFSWTIEVITHELGHLYGSPHTHGCYWNGDGTAIDGCGTQAGYIEGDCETGPIPDNQGTIMSYCHLIDGVGINFANGFGEQPAARIINHIERSQCLSTDCVNTCINTVSAFAVTDTSMNSATITWTDENAGPWMVGYSSVNGNINNWREVSTTSFTASGLNANTYYKFYVRPVCTEGREAESQQLVFATNADWCSGTIFRDTNPNGNYPNDQHLIRTITPENASQSYTVTFTSFDTEENFDYMYVYDGANTSAPLLGAYSGSEIPGPFTSTATDGSLTFEFISDSYETENGWSATVSCTLNAKESTFVNLQYYPNPTNGSVTITSPEGITGISVYNVAGQLLLNKTINATTTDADIAQFANGVYFFKVTNGTKTSNFRIIKQ